MPTLDQADTSMYGHIELIPGAGMAQRAQQSAGPNAAMVRLGLDEQRKAQVNSIFQQFGDDYDGAVKAVMTIDPELGMKLGQMVQQGKKAGIETEMANTESSMKTMDLMQRRVQEAIVDPTQYPKLLDDLAKTPGGDQYMKYAPDPTDPQLVQKLQNIHTALGDSKEFSATMRQSMQDFLNGDVQLGAARSLAEANTPEKRQIVVAKLQQAHVGEIADQWQTPEEAAAARDVMLAQKEKVKPGTEKGGQHIEGLYQGKRTFGVFDPNTNTFNVDGKQVSATEFRPIPPASLIVQNQNAGAVADSIKGQARTTLSGKTYVDLGDFGTPKEQSVARAAALKAGLIAVDAKTGSSLRAVDTAKQNAISIWNQIKDKLPKDAQGRLAAGPRNKLSAYFQTDADLAAFGAWRTAAIQQVQALAEPGMGLRINQAEIKQAMDNDIPQITDDVGTAAQRIKNLLTMLNHKENDALTRDRSSLLTVPSQAPAVNPFKK